MKPIHCTISMYFRPFFLTIILAISGAGALLASMPGMHSPFAKTDVEVIEKNVNSNETSEKTQDYFDENFLRFSDYVYSNSVKTVLFNKKGAEFSMPVYELGSSDILELRFDDVENSLRSLSYTIMHCTPSWEPSPLEPYEYIDGFQHVEIMDYKYSFNTLVSYIHYKAEFPSAQMRPKVSGNYLLIVFEGNNPENLVLSRRFFVYEPRVDVGAQVRMATRIDDRKYKQEVNFTIRSAGSYHLTNPFEDVKVVVRQNGRWDNAITNLKPSLVRGNSLIYEYEDGNLFDGGNEFRNVDLKSLKFVTSRIDRYQRTNSGWNAYLLPDERRTFKRYVSGEDINGRFLVKNDEASDSHTESDYLWMHFILPYSPFQAQGSMYVFGELSDWGFPLSHRMNYNFRSAAYELRLLLKQGYYNYAYVFLENQSQQGDITLIEGNHSEAENQYTIMVYHKAYGSMHHALVGFTTVTAFGK